MEPDDSERRSRDTRPQPARREPRRARPPVPRRAWRRSEEREELRVGVAVRFGHAPAGLEEAVPLVERFKDGVAFGAFDADDFAADFAFGGLQFVEGQLQQVGAGDPFPVLDGVVLAELGDEECGGNVGG